MRGGLSNKGWTYYWQDMRKDGEWVDATFVQATAWFTGLDIFLFIVGNENPDNPFAHFNGVIDSDEVRPRGDHTLLIGYIDDQHYQSLLPLDREMDPLQVDEALRSTLSALKLELSKPSCEASSSQLADSDQVQSTISDTTSNQEDFSTSQDNPSGNTSKTDDVWPSLFGFRTEFVGKKWKCPFCGKEVTQIDYHLRKSHDDTITNWDGVESYCEEIRVMKRKGINKKHDQKRNQRPERKKFKREWNQQPERKKSEQERNQQPERKEYQRERNQQPERKKYKSDWNQQPEQKKKEQERNQQPERKEDLREAGRKHDQKRSQEPERKKYLKEWAQTEFGKFQKQKAVIRYREKLGDIRRRAQYRKYKQTKIDRELGGDAVMRRRKFQKAVLRGPEFECSSCHRSLFRKSVTVVTDHLKGKIREACEERLKKQNQDTGMVQSTFSENTKIKSKLKKAFKFFEDASKAWHKYLINSVDEVAYLCSTCKSSLQKGNIPAMAVANGLQLNHPDRPLLTELENNLIAHNINFQKLVLLQKSRWAAGKGRMISVPIRPDDIMNTVKRLPRLPDDAGLI